jgi:hypothetical protein
MFDFTVLDAVLYNRDVETLGDLLDLSRTPSTPRGVRAPMQSGVGAPIQSGVGAPIQFDDTKHHNRRLRDRAARNHQRQNPNAPKRPRGRPRAVHVQRPQKAMGQRIARMHAKVAKISAEAGGRVQACKAMAPDSFDEAFHPGMKHVGELIGCVRTIVSTRKGVMLSPDLAEQEGKRLMHEEVGRSSCKMIREDIRGGAKSSITKGVSEFVSDLSMFAQAIGSNTAYVKKARKNVTIAACLSLHYDLKGSYTSYTHTVEPELHKVLECFFLRTSNCRSGAKSRAMTTFRELPMKESELKISLFAEFPSYCREAAQTWPAWFKKVAAKTSNVTKWEKSVLASVASTPSSPHEQEHEWARRRAEARTAYHEQLRDNRFRFRGASLCNSVERSNRYEEKLKVFEAAELEKLRMYDIGTCPSDSVTTFANYSVDFDLTSGDIKPPSLRLFFKIIKKFGYSWSQNVYPTECPIHDSGPCTLLKLAAATTKLKALRISMDVAAANLDQNKEDKGLRHQEEVAREAYANFLKEVRDLEASKCLYERHLEQYEVCRKVIKKIECNLKPGEAVLYRDFVAQYMTGGGKLSNLVFVVLWHDGNKVGKFTQVMKFNHFCADKDTRSQDAYYMADVWKWFLGGKQGSSQFLRREQIHTLYVSGDHGPHFSSIQTMWLESLFFDRYGILLHSFFLCSYHAFNRCDGAGVESKKLHQNLISVRKALPLAVDVSDHLNRSE